MTDRLPPYYVYRHFCFFQSTGEKPELGLDKWHYIDKYAPLSVGCFVYTVYTVSNVFVTQLSKVRRFLHT